MVKISVIVPVYNSGKYIKECLDSIINQTFKDIEILCINDGSTDDSLDILKEYSEKDERIKVFTQENKGPGISRNVGIDNSNGEYIVFIDSDDFVEVDYCEKLFQYSSYEDCDLTFCKFARYNSLEGNITRGNGFNFDRYFDFDNNENFLFKYTDIKNEVLNGSFSPCCKLYKKSFLEDNGLYFKGGYYEDVLFHVMTLLYAEKVAFCNKDLYYYRISNKSSIINTSSYKKHIFDIFNVLNDVETFLVENDYFQEFEYEFYSLKIAQVLQYLNLASEEFKDEMYSKSLESFSKVDLDQSKLILSKKNLNRFYSLKKSKSYEAFTLNLNILELKDRISFLEDIEKQNHENELKLNGLQEFIEKQKKDYESKISDKNSEIKELKSILNEMKSSNSWKLTEPMRKLGNLKRNLAYLKK